ncbi:hypothetical protein EDD11_003293 [Mortierella claussenii]|nr:hypothetical protein EDD11_003293 [Mortierella claussenii]
MKFAKHLQEEAVPEWRKAYLNYKQGKKHLKAIGDAIAKLDDANQEQHDDSVEDNGTRTLRLIIDSPRHLSSHVATTQSSSHQPISPQTWTQEPDNEQQQQYYHHPERPAPIYSPDITPDSPTGATPIISQGRGRLRSYDTIPIQGHPSTSSDTTQPPMTAMRSRNRQYRYGDKAHKSSKALQGDSQRLVRRNDPDVEDDSIDSVMDCLLDEEKQFFAFLDEQLAIVDGFYREKELEAVTKLKVLKQQLFVADEWKRRYDDKIARAQANRGWYQAEFSRVRQGFGNLMIDSSITEDVTLGPPSRARQIFLDSRCQHPTTSSTYANAGSEQRLGYRENQEPTGWRGARRLPLDPTTHQSQLVLDEAESRRQHLNHTVARTRIKAALYEFYRSLEMLKNYKVLNHTGFVKIMKKFDKTAGWKASKAFKSSKLHPTYFMSSVVLDDLSTETEDLFIEKFEKGHRRRGMAKLRIPDPRSQSHHGTVARVGIYIGLAIPLLIQGIQSALSVDTQAEIPYWSSLLLVYAGLFLTILFSCLFGINMYVWAKSRINYKFIFEFDPRDNLDYHEFFELPVFFMLVLCVAFYLNFGTTLTRHFMTTYYPLIVVCVIAAILFCPLPVMNSGARKWFLQSFGRLLVSGYYGVEFRDFFLADELNSLAYSIEQFEFALCAYTQDWENLTQTCTTSKIWLTPFVTAIPSWFRFLQCLRRYRDTLEWFPHLVNAGKYFSTLAQLFVYFTYRHYGTGQIKVVYIVVSLLASMYTYSWDVYMDWGLLRFGKHGGGAYGHPLLRAELVYDLKSVYYLAMVLDFFGRFAWMVRLIPMQLNVMALSFILATVEVLRRWMWNFFRLENEHLNNCGQFRAIKDIPLPFHIRVEGDSDDEENDGDEHEDVEREDGRDGQGRSHKTATVKFSGEEDMEALAEGSGSDPKAAAMALATERSRKQGLARIPSSRSGGSGSGRALAAQIGSPAAASSTSVRSSTPSSVGGSVSRRSGLRKQPIQTAGMPQSNTFVDDAMVEAGFKDDQREHLTNINKFYDRRDFDTKIIDGAPEGLFRVRTRSNTARSGRDGAGSKLQGLGIDTEGESGHGGAVGSGGYDGATGGRTRRIKSRLFGSRDDSGDEDEDTDEDDEDVGR